jgi:hypothetical protein
MVGDTCSSTTNMEIIPPFTLSKKIGGRKLSANIDILTFKPQFNPISHIQQCEKERRKAGYIDERVWPHMFPNTLEDIPHKMV